MSYLTKVKIATQNLEDKIIDYQEWAEIVLGPDYKNVFFFFYLRRACKVFGIFLKYVESQVDDKDNTEELNLLFV